MSILGRFFCWINVPGVFYPTKNSSQKRHLLPKSDIRFPKSTVGKTFCWINLRGGFHPTKIFFPKSTFSPQKRHSLPDFKQKWKKSVSQLKTRRFHPTKKSHFWEENVDFGKNFLLDKKPQAGGHPPLSIFFKKFSRMHFRRYFSKSRVNFHLLL